jgi:hypothetical protein
MNFVSFLGIFMDELAFHYDAFKFHTPFLKYKIQRKHEIETQKPFNLLSLCSSSFGQLTW